MTVLPVFDPGFHTSSKGEQAATNQSVEGSDRAERAALVDKPESVKPDLAWSTDLADLAAEIERNGIDSIAPLLLAELARSGLGYGLHPEVAAIIGDSNAPAVARERAFGLLHSTQFADRFTKSGPTMT